MGKESLEINFSIYDSNPFERAKPWNRFGVSPVPLLKFESSNYRLDKDEILRASLRPNQLVLNNNHIYIKEREIAYHNKGYENMLKVRYILSDAVFKE